MAETRSISPDSDDQTHLVITAHDAVAQELVATAIHATMLEPSPAADAVRRGLERAQERMLLLLRALPSEEASSYRAITQPAVLADLLTEFVRSQPAHLEIRYVMDAPLLLPPAIREALFLFLREGLLRVSENAPGQRVLLDLELKDGIVTCSLEHPLDEVVVPPVVVNRVQELSQASVTQDHGLSSMVASIR